jgi:hypothetical protein
MEHVMGDLNYWTDLLTEMRVGWIAGSEHKEYEKMASIFAQPYSTPSDCNTVDIPYKKDILLAQKSAVEKHERIQQSKATDHREEPPQCVDTGGMRMMQNALWIPERAVKLQLFL